MSKNSNNDGEQDLHIDLAESVSHRSNEERDKSKVFIEINESSSQFILDYSQSDTSQELGGILLGSFFKKEEQYHVCVEAAVEALYTEAAKGSVTFTHKTWEHINKVREEQYPDYKIVGWFHTHPGFGIFLSSYDKFIHKNFFNLPWQVAYVIDPVAGQHGFFGWSNNSIEKLPFKALIAPYKQKEISIPVKLKEKKTPPFGSIAIASAMTILLITNGYLLFLNNENKNNIEELKLNLSDLEFNIDNKQSLINQLTEANDELRSQQDANETEDLFTVYHVAPGDSLWSISENLFGDGNLYPELIKYNKIEEPDRILAGERLFVPLVLLDR